MGGRTKCAGGSEGVPIALVLDVVAAEIDLIFGVRFEEVVIVGAAVVLVVLGVLVDLLNPGGVLRCVRPWLAGAGVRISGGDNAQFMGPA
eukprot:10179932-Alexandrium_andersonii.AAC.1